MQNNCPICDSRISLPSGTEESEIVSCPDCHTRLVVSSLQNGVATLGEAPRVEEDWGE